MANPLFPVLTMPPTTDFNSGHEDGSDIASPMEDGYEVTRFRFGRDRQFYEVPYNLLPQADMDKIDAFYQTVRKSVFFDWTHPTRGTSITVRFVDAPVVKYVGHDSVSGNMWQVSFKLREV